MLGAGGDNEDVLQPPEKGGWVVLVSLPRKGLAANVQLQSGVARAAG